MKHQTIVNTGKIPLSVTIKMADGKLGSVQAMPKAHIKLPLGATVDRNYITLNPKLKIKE